MELKNFTKWIKKIDREALIWVIGLTLMATMDLSEQHISLCPLKNLGLSFCPGCGLGHSIAYLFRGDIHASLAAHPLGIFAVVMLTYRIVHLTISSVKQSVK